MDDDIARPTEDDIDNAVGKIATKYGLLVSDSVRDALHQFGLEVLRRVAQATGDREGEDRGC